MGMFDDITCEADLPGEPQPPNRGFQTKDFDCALDHYTITKDGRLVGPTGFLEHHGFLNFYTYISDKNDGRSDGMWWEYEAKFTDGKLVGIECTKIARCRFGKPREPIWPTRASEASK